MAHKERSLARLRHPRKKQKKRIAQEPPTATSEAEQIRLAELANQYFREQIAKHEAEIVKAIKKKLEEDNLAYENPIKINNINMKHIMFADWNQRKQKPTGLHSKRWNPERIIAIKIPPGKLGTWDGEVQLHCKTKPSTFFPDSWNEYKIVDKIIESLLNVDSIEVSGNRLKIDGYTSENIVIELYLLADGKITSSYPALYYKETLCIY